MKIKSWLKKYEFIFWLIGIIIIMILLGIIMVISN